MSSDFDEMLRQIQQFPANLLDDTAHLLAEMYSADALMGTENSVPITIDKITRTSMVQGAVLNQIMRQQGVTHSLEIGCAYGFSTVWMLDAIRDRQGGKHISVDPFERRDWGGVGLFQANRLVNNGEFEWIEDFSIHAIPSLIRTGSLFDFVYIDGNHRFDDVIVDFYLVDQILRPGSLVALDDLWMPSIQAALRFVMKNRAYEWIQQPIENMAVLQKRDNDDRPWNHFHAF